MTNDLSNLDYEKILNYYNLSIPKSKRLLKNQAESILAEKLCKCIKKVSAKLNTKEPRSIGICTKSVFQKKGFTRGKFTCKGKRYVNFRKTKTMKRKKL